MDLDSFLSGRVGGHQRISGCEAQGAFLFSGCQPTCIPLQRERSYMRCLHEHVRLHASMCVAREHVLHEHVWMSSRFI